MCVEVKLEPRDLWVGLFWDRRPDPWGVRRLEVWVCPLPGLVIHVYFWPGRRS
jgi:hypothetical protein